MTLTPEVESLEELALFTGPQSLRMIWFISILEMSLVLSSFLVGSKAANSRFACSNRVEVTSQIFGFHEKTKASLVGVAQSPKKEFGYIYSCWFNMAKRQMNWFMSEWNKVRLSGLKEFGGLWCGDSFFDCN